MSGAEFVRGRDVQKPSIIHATALFEINLSLFSFLFDSPRAGTLVSSIRMIIPTVISIATVSLKEKFTNHHFSFQIESRILGVLDSPFGVHFPVRLQLRPLIKV